MGIGAATRARAALRAGLRTSRPDSAPDAAGYVATWRDNLLPGLEAEQAGRDLAAGGGRELAGKFRAAHSSSALAVNVFAPFQPAPETLPLAGMHGALRLDFERRCPTGLGGTPPHLDLVLEAAEAVVGVESKCLEYLTPKRPAFAASYFAADNGLRRAGPWFALMQALAEGQTRFAHLDAAQLVKHAFGLDRSFPARRVTLRYLFWEPRNPAADPVFARHRAEIGRFAETVAGDRIGFVAQSYPELWAEWDRRPGAGGLSAHLAALRRRYAVAI